MTEKKKNKLNHKWKPALKAYIKNNNKNKGSTMNWMFETSNTDDTSICQQGQTCQREQSAWILEARTLCIHFNNEERLASGLG